MNGGEPSDSGTNRAGSAQRLIHAAMVMDATTIHAPGALLLDGERVVAVGAPAAIGAAGVDAERYHDALVVPGLVNAHAHLDLTHVGALPFTGDFEAWLGSVRDRRPTGDAAIAESVAEGARRAIDGGTVLIGDIAGNGQRAPFEALAASGLGGVSYREHFGIGASRARGADALANAAAAMPPWTAPLDVVTCREGVQPHAPYSVAADGFRAALAAPVPCATHLAETHAEARFVRDGTGPQRAFLAALGLDDDSITGHGVSPVAWFAAQCANQCSAVESAAPRIVAHVNYPEAGDLDALRACGAIVAYCPRASAAFGHPVAGAAPHAYRTMLDAGIPVALGTDSSCVLDRHDRLSVLDEMRLLITRDRLSAQKALAMATVHGARGLGFAPELVTFTPGASAGVLALHATASIADASAPESWLRHDVSIEWIMRATPTVCR